MNTEKPRKRILFIAPQPFFEVRGTPIAIKDMLNILKENYSIDLVTYPQGSELKIDNVNQYRCFSLFIRKVKIGPSIGKIVLDVSLFFKSLYLLFSNKYDYIHAVEEAALFGVLFKKISGAKLVYDMDSIMSEQVSNSKFGFAKKVFEIIERIIIRNSDLILAVSPNFKDYCLEIKSDCNFVEIFDVPQIEEVDIPSSLKVLFPKSDRKKVLYIGNGEKYQGVSLLEEVADIMPEVDFFIIGTGRNEQVGNRIYISSIEMKYVWGVMQLVDALAAPRLAGTNTPMKIYTYMASGIPIVCTNIVAHEILNDCAYVAGIKIDSFSNAVNRSIGDSDNKAGLAKIKVSKAFSFKKLKETVINSYET